MALLGVSSTLAQRYFILIRINSIALIIFKVGVKSSVLQEVLSVASPTYLGGLPDRVGGNIVLLLSPLVNLLDPPYSIHQYTNIPCTNLYRLLPGWGVSSGPVAPEEHEQPPGLHFYF